MMADLSAEGKMIYENCEQNYSTKNHYDCQCIAANSESYIGPAIDSRTEGLKTLIAAKEGAIKKNNANPNLTAEKKAQSENALRARIAKEQAEIKKIEDRANWDNNMRHAIVNSIEINIYQESTCKVGEGWREKEYSTCMSATTLNNIKGNTGGVLQLLRRYGGQAMDQLYSVIQLQGRRRPPGTGTDAVPQLV